MFVRFLKSSPMMCPSVPAPAVDQRRPCALLPFVTRSCGVLIDPLAALPMAAGVTETSTIGVRLLTVS